MDWHEQSEQLQLWSNIRKDRASRFYRFLVVLTRGSRCMSFTSFGHFITFFASLEVAGRWIGGRKVDFIVFFFFFFLLECNVLLLLLLQRFREFTNANVLRMLLESRRQSPSSFNLVWTYLNTYMSYT
jgi:hypothetical protein